jgi:hypothetical protein
VAAVRERLVVVVTADLVAVQGAAATPYNPTVSTDTSARTSTTTSRCWRRNEEIATR